MDRFETKLLGSLPDAMAPDGCEVRVLCITTRGSMAHFALGPGLVSRAVAHRTVEELWCFTRGRGRIWRRTDQAEETVEVGPGVSISIPIGGRFQFRNDGEEPLEAISVTMPPWPGPEEALPVQGIWEPTA
jgi:mannose-6-phosphate isomerase-like protein (cupin superfamily)